KPRVEALDLISASFTKLTASGSNAKTFSRSRRRSRQWLCAGLWSCLRPLPTNPKTSLEAAEHQDNGGEPLSLLPWSHRRHRQNDRSDRDDRRGSGGEGINKVGTEN